jgi:hypothetical protein
MMEKGNLAQGLGGPIQEDDSSKIPYERCPGVTTGSGACEESSC